MATQSLRVTLAVQDVTAELSLTRRSRYTLQNVGAYQIRIAEAAAAPEPGSAPAHQLAIGEYVSYTVDDSENLYAWLPEGRTGSSWLSATPER